jgi:translation initiation factor 3 subunit B
MAEELKKLKDGKPMDAKNTYRIFNYNDYESIVFSPDEFVPPSQTDLKQGGRNLNTWLLDEFGRDQFVLRYGAENAAETQICWNDPVRRGTESDGMEVFFDKRKSELKIHPSKPPMLWTKYVKWSTHGSYLATFHTQGIQLWGGPECLQMGKFEHDKVQQIEFSPGEKYLVTASWTHTECIVKVWDVVKKCHTKLLTTAIRPGQLAENHREFKFEANVQWPVFQWSHDDKYFFRVTQRGQTFMGKENKDGQLNVFQTPSLKGIKTCDIKGIQEACWSPGAHIIAYWIPETKNTPASISMRQLIPDSAGGFKFDILREKSLYAAENAQMHWQSNGEFLCVKFSLRQSKKTLRTNLEIFRMLEKDIPVEVIDIADPVVLHVAWEPRGRTLSIIHGQGDSSNVTRQMVSFYEVTTKSTKLRYSLERNCDRVYWSPAGSVAVLAPLEPRALEFYDVKNNQKLQSSEHFKCSGVAWDPSGRYVATFAAQPLEEQSWQFAAENGYKIWSFQGELLVTVPKDSLFQFIWRPRPPSTLSFQQISDIKRELKAKYWTEFELEAQKIAKSTQNAALTHRQKIQKEWREFLRSCAATYSQESLERQEKFGEVSDDEGDNSLSDTVVQTLISITETPGPLFETNPN